MDCQNHRRNKRNWKASRKSFLWNSQKYGLTVPSTLMVEQTTTVSLTSFDKRIGKILDKNVLGDISRAVRVQFPVIAI